MNTNPNSIRILCFGDSNTWGYISGTNKQRHNTTTRWPGVLQNILGSDYEVIEEGLNSRTLTSNDPRPGKVGRRGIDYILPCLDTHDPLDWIVVMLGSNEMKHQFNKSAQVISIEMRNFLEIILNRPSQVRSQKPQVFLISPPFIDETTDFCKKDDIYKNATAKSLQLGSLYSSVAQELGIFFLDSAPITNLGPDGCHITEESHNLLAQELKKIIQSPLG